MKLRRLVALTSLTVLAGCGSSAATSDSFITQYCDLISPCCGMAGLPTDGKQCRALFTALAGIGGSYDATAGGACLNELKAQSKNPDFCTSSMSGADCNNVYKTANSGTVQPGAACMKDGDCAASSEGKVRCVFGFNMNQQTQTCQVQVVGKEGDTPCIATIDGNSSSSSGSGMPASRGYTCDRKDSLRCDFQSMKCTRLLDVGGMCSSSGTFDNPCVGTAYCDSTMRMCAPKKSAGAACQAFSSGECAMGTYCDSMAKVCTMSLATNAPCTNGDACASNSCVNSKCRASNNFGDQLLCGSM